MYALLSTLRKRFDVSQRVLKCFDRSRRVLKPFDVSRARGMCDTVSHMCPNPNLANYYSYAYPQVAIWLSRGRMSASGLIGIWLSRGRMSASGLNPNLALTRAHVPIWLDQ